MKQNKKTSAKKITRKEAIAKAGKLAILTAASMLILNPPQKAAAQSPAAPPPNW